MPLDLGRLIALAIWYAPYAIEFFALLVTGELAFRHAGRRVSPRYSAPLVSCSSTWHAGEPWPSSSRAWLPWPRVLSSCRCCPSANPSSPTNISYLLAADTFASGRLTNPTHPMWVHFESMHILEHPTYAAMHHAAQGVILAAGQVAVGNPWAGVYVSVAVMCALLCWMLQGWLPPVWALFGGLLAVLRLGLFGYWINSYWGGAAAAIGGLLVLGAMPRLLRKLRVRDALLLAGGMVILANSRPYEGLLLSLPVCVYLAVRLLKPRGPQLAAVALRLVLPAALLWPSPRPVRATTTGA